MLESAHDPDVSDARDASEEVVTIILDSLLPLDSSHGQKIFDPWLH